jgi:thiamine-phosphate pyrophosphorylase
MRIFMTDRGRQPDWRGIIRNLRRGDHVIIRDYDHPNRASLAQAIIAVCKQHGVSYAIGGDMRLAWRLKAGVHLTERDLRRGPICLWSGRHHSAAIHQAHDLKKASDMGANLALISPVFATRSHPNARVLGRVKYHHLAQQARRFGLSPVALGGMTRYSARALFGVEQPRAKIAAIDGIADLCRLYFCP